MSIQPKPKRPLLRYFGGKWQLRHWITEHFPEHRFYAEPFAGAASVLLGKDPAPKGEIINDLNGDTVNLFRVLQDRKTARDLLWKLRATPYSKSEFDLAREPSSEPVERARRYCIASFMGIHTAGGKVSRSTGFRMGNVKLSNFGSAGRSFRNCAADWANWRGALPAIIRRLDKVMIYSEDALGFIAKMDSPDALIYVDPPYHQDKRSAHRYSVEFIDHMELARVLNECTAKVVLSGYDCAPYAWLELNGWRKVEKEYRANMSDKRRVECLWMNYEPPTRNATKNPKNPKK